MKTLELGSTFRDMGLAITGVSFTVAHPEPVGKTALVPGGREITVEFGKLDKRKLRRQLRRAAKAGKP